MRVRYSTLARPINIQNPTINIPCESILDCVALKCAVTIVNTGAESATPNIAEVLAAIEEIKLTTDGNVNHYSVNGLDVARMNMFDGHEGDAAVLKKTCSPIAVHGSGTETFMLLLDQGDILGVDRDHIDLKVQFKQTEYKPGMVIANANVTVTTIEVIPTVEEMAATYGPNLEKFVEPKVIGITDKNPGNTEFTGFMDLPTGTILRRAFASFDVAPERVGIKATSPENMDLMNVDWETYRAIDKFRHATNGQTPDNTIVIDYGTQLAANGEGLYGWNWRKGDYQFATRNAAEVNMRYISCETVVNQGIFEKYGAVFEVPIGL